MTKYKVVYERNACIGAAFCLAVDPDNWVMRDDNKADLLNYDKKRPVEIYEKVFDDKQFDVMKLSAFGCPVKCIHLINLDTGEQLI